MRSEIKTKNNLFLKPEISYLIEIPFNNLHLGLKKFSWLALHSLLPREVRNEGILTNMKGMSINNILKVGLDKQSTIYENPIYRVKALASPSEEDKEETLEESNEKFDCHFEIETAFYGFLDKKNIQYKSSIKADERLREFFAKPVYEDDNDIEIEDIYIGIEYFKPNLFWMIGMAPKVTSSLIIQSQNKTLYLRFTTEGHKNGKEFFESFGDNGQMLSDFLSQNLGLDLLKDFATKSR